MGELENYQRYINGSLSEREKDNRLREVYQEAEREWFEHECYHSILHDGPSTHPKREAMLRHMIKRGIL